MRRKSLIGPLVYIIQICFSPTLSFAFSLTSSTFYLSPLTLPVLQSSIFAFPKTLLPCFHQLTQPFIPVLYLPLPLPQVTTLYLHLSPLPLSQPFISYVSLQTRCLTLALFQPYFSPFAPFLAQTAFLFWAAAPNGSMTYAFTHMGAFLLLLLRPPTLYV